MSLVNTLVLKTNITKIQKKIKKNIIFRKEYCRLKKLLEILLYYSNDKIILTINGNLTKHYDRCSLINDYEASEQVRNCSCFYIDIIVEFIISEFQNKP